MFLPHFDILELWSITEQTPNIMESICFIWENYETKKIGNDVIYTSVLQQIKSKNQTKIQEKIDMLL